MTSPVDSQFYRMLLEEEGNNMRELLDAEEYLVPQPNLFPRAHGDGTQSNGPSRHQSYRVSGEDTSYSCGSNWQSCYCDCRVLFHSVFALNVFHELI